MKSVQIFNKKNRL